MFGNFDRKSGSYRDAAGVQRELTWYLAEWLPENAPGQTAFELGAGDGLFTERLRFRFDRVVASDASENMIEHGAEMVPEAEWVVADAWEPSGEHFGASWVCSASLLQWCDEPAAVLRHWRELSQPGTRQLHGFFVKPTLPEWDAVAETGSLDWRTPERWVELFEEAGFTVASAEKQTRVFLYESARDFLRTIHDTGATLEEHLGAGELRRILREYDALWSDDAGTRATWTFFRILAKL